jgi:hypothetical protein
MNEVILAGQLVSTCGGNTDEACKKPSMGKQESTNQEASLQLVKRLQFKLTVFFTNEKTLFQR